MASQLDIARKTGISQSIISRVLSGNWKSCKIARKTAEKVLQAADELGYKPNRAANIVFGRKTNLIGVIIRSFHDPFLNIVLDEVNERAVSHDMGIVVAGLSSHRDPIDAVQLLQGYRPDALIVVGTVDFSGWTDYLNQMDKKVIQIGLPADHPMVISCGTNEQAAAEMLIRHLLDLGHRKFGFVMDNSRTSQARLSALQNVLNENDLEMIDDMVVEGCDISGETDPGRFNDLLQEIRNGQITAVVCAGDMIAGGVSRDLIQAGIRIPEDISLASYNDVPMAAVLNPPLTTVHLPVRDIVATAMDIATGQTPEKSVEIGPSLMIRESTGPGAPAQE